VVAKNKRGAAPPVLAKGSERAPAVADAAVVRAPDASVPAPATVDAAVVAETGSGPTTPPPRVNTEVAQLLADAEDAQRRGNRLRQIVKAAAALDKDPRNVRARLILADGLIADGDLDRGCKYLRDLGRNPTARARAAKAGCPTN
jgi:thioredoxin-like negative regulator of GroEL